MFKLTTLFAQPDPIPEHMNVLLLKNVLVGYFGWQTDVAAHLEFMIIGGLIVWFLIVEPHGLAQLWRLGKEKLRMWPFPY